MRFLLAVVSVACMTGCICTDPVTGRPYFCVSEPSDAAEVEIGAQLALDFTAANGGAYPDAELSRFLDEIVVGKLAPVSHRPELPWRFVVLNTSEINAFALPGGRVFVTRGLLAELETEAQFAHLMGHEIGHVAHKHSLRGEGRNVLLGVLVGAIGLAERNAKVLLTGEDDAPLVVTSVAGAVGNAAFLKFSRDQELESDERGVDYAVAAGYDPREATRTFTTFQRLKEEAGRSENRIAGLLSTHPLDSTRRSAVADYIASHHGDAVTDALVVSGPEWATQLQRLQGAHGHYRRLDDALSLLERGQSSQNEAYLDEVESVLREVARRLSDHATPHVALALVATRRDDARETRRHVERALGLDPTHFEGLLLRGVLNRNEGRFDEAVRDLTAAATTYPSSPLPCFQLGRVAEDRGDAEQAVAWYQKVIARSARGSTIRDLARARLEALRRG